MPRSGREEIGAAWGCVEPEPSGRRGGYAAPVSAQAPYRSYVAPAPVGPSVTICRSCGIVAPTEGTACEGCGKPIAEVRVQVPSQAADMFWVAVKCGFTCNQCRFLAPLDGLDVDGAVDCAHCGLRQRFDVAAWKSALAFAHAVGDLAGPDPEGRTPHPAIWIGDENPHVDVGVKRTFVQPEAKLEKPAALDGDAAVIAAAVVAQSSSVVDTHASPGHPVCKRCRVPLVATVTGPGAVSTRCPTCSEEARYTLVDSARHIHAGLVAAVADEHRSDRPRAQPMPTQAGVVAIKCPGCGAPLQLQGAEKVQTCTFCKASCFVAGKNLARFHHKTPEPEVWWVLFRGPSPERERLTAATLDVAADGKKLVAFLKPGAMTDTIGEKPGVYEAPEQPGIHWPQVLLTVALGLVAVAVGYLIAGT